MMEKGRPSAVTWEMSWPAVAARATKPGRVTRRMRARPSATRARFSPWSSIMSESVPSVATSM